MLAVHGIDTHPARRVAVDVPIAAEDLALFRIAQAQRGRDEAIQNRIEIEGCPADRLEDIRRRRLLLQQLLEVARLCLNLVEQAHVFDRDHRLVGEGLEQLDVMRGEVSGLLAGDADHADGGAFAHQRRDQHAAIAAQAREFAVQGRHVIRLGIGELDGCAIADEQERRKFGQWPRE